MKKTKMAQYALGILFGIVTLTEASLARSVVAMNSRAFTTPVVSCSFTFAADPASEIPENTIQLTLLVEDGSDDNSNAKRTIDALAVQVSAGITNAPDASAGYVGRLQFANGLPNLFEAKTKESELRVEVGSGDGKSIYRERQFFQGEWIIESTHGACNHIQYGSGGVHN